VRLWPQPRAPIDGRHFDVAIIGGGINGVAIARECARAGRRTLLVEQNDFASGTTSRSTRIIHGGLRYLEHGEIGMVRESLRERQRLLSERPNLVRPMDFVLVLPPGHRSSLEIRFGLWLYRKWAHSDRKPLVSDQSVERLLDAGDRKLRLFAYDDAQCEFPERLVAEWLTDALEWGATVRNHTRVLHVDTRDGQVRGLRLRDNLRNFEYRIDASRVVNASGPWADTVCRDSNIDTSEAMIGGLRGSHIVVPRFAGAPHNAVYAEASDGRPVFLVPWNGQLLFGTTEVRDSADPGQTQPSANELEYLVTSFRGLFPSAPQVEITHAFAGIRPLPFAPGKNAASISRRHSLHDHAAEGAAGMISVIGGKLTTAASLARECARKIGIVVPEPKSIGVVNTPLFTAALESLVRDVALIGNIDASSAQGLVSRHGERATAIAQLIGLDDRLRDPIVTNSSYLLAEAAFAVQREAAITLADILLRRVPVALGPDWSDDTAHEAASKIGDIFGWTAENTERELGAFHTERSNFLIKPTSACQAA
jgi:glycerol-3-phosphate dehydrogenase